MLFVLFHLGQERYALEAACVVEVVPLLALKQVPKSPRGVAGVFIYRGRPVLAVDLCKLTLGRPAQENFSTRIILINHGNKPGEQQQLVGLIAERVTETLRREKSDFINPSLQTSSSPFMGPVLMDAKGMVQVVNPGQLILEELGALVCAPQLSILGANLPAEVIDATH
ncbi:MAG: chemotaxis protein CheW [Verrucomicrobia bacterium]|jgi:chemotaxis-related protein WspB|nr:MAG: chemotaxis protein CheW [Verrucomicrobiota bacterium]